MHIQVRNAAIPDTPVLLEMFCELGRPGPRDAEDAAMFASVISRYIHDADKRLLVAYYTDGNDADSTGIIVGLASIILLPRCSRRGPELYIPDLITRPEHRGRGVGRMLIDACVGIAREHHCHRIRLESANWRKESHAFYRHLGFEQSALSFELLPSTWRP